MEKRNRVGLLERAVYSEICSSDGIKAKDLGKTVSADRTTVNRLLYSAPFMRELCYRDADYLWHGYVRQARPHEGLRDFCGWYGTAAEFLQLTPEQWFGEMTEGCRRVGRNLNDTRGLFHSFRDARDTVEQLFRDMEGVFRPDWEIAFELRINRARYIRIYADVLVLTEDRAFSLEFKMKDVIDPDEVVQAAKYSPYLEVLFGPSYDVIPALVLTGARDLYTYAPLPGTDAEIPVVSGDMLFNLFDEYLGFLENR